MPLSTTDERLRAMAAFFALALLCAVVWGRTLGHGFVWDDEYFILKNPAIRDWRFIPAYFTDVRTMFGEVPAPMFRPIRNISYLMDFYIAGLEPAWWHFHNLVLHWLNAVLVFLIARRLLTGTTAPLFAAALFLVHPVQSEPVAWIKCRDDLLSSLFLLWAMLVWLRWRPDVLRPGRLFVLGALYALACLTKINAIVFPAALALLEWLAPRDVQGRDTARSQTRVSPRALLVSLVWLGALGAAILLWRHTYIGKTAQSGYPAGAFWPTMLTMIRCGADYLRLIVFPARLLADYSGIEASHSLLDRRVLFSGTALLAVGAAAWVLRRRSPVACLGILWVSLFLLPVSNVVPTMQYMADRFLYLPLAGVSFAAGALYGALERRARAVAWILAGVALLAAGVQANRRAGVWGDEILLYQVTVRDTPESVTRPRFNLANKLLNAGRIDEAAPMVESLYENMRKDPTRPAIYKAIVSRNLGYVRMVSGETTASLKLLWEAAWTSPDYAQPFEDMGVMAGREGRHAEALEYFDQAVRRAPDMNSAHYNRGIALRELGRTDEAIEAFRLAARGAPTTPDAHKDLAALLWRQGRFHEAAEAYKQALRIWPADEEMIGFLEGAMELAANE